MTSSLSENLAREEICRVGKSLFDRGYVHATAGNISVRLDDDAGGGFLITPTDACLGFLDPARLARLDAQGQHLNGDAPSKTIVLHSRIYRAMAPLDPKVRCIIHTHSTHCVQLTLQRAAIAEPGTAHAELLPPITPYFVMKVGRVPVIAYDRPGAPQTAERVEQAIQHYATQSIALRAVMLERLGPNVWHASPAHAMATLEELEETAKLYWLSKQAVAPLEPTQLVQLRQVFHATW
jgi:ribulose-5-phosphate 4-epimerase/fuculose-1-phosphate aldolase